MKKIISICLLFVLLLTACGTPNPPLEGSGTTVPTDNETTLSDDTNTTVPDDTDTTVPGDTDTTVPGDTDTTVPDDTDTTVPDNTDTSTPGSDEPDIPEEQVKTTLAPYEAGLQDCAGSLVFESAKHMPNSTWVKPYKRQTIYEEDIDDYTVTVNGTEYTGKYVNTEIFGSKMLISESREYYCLEKKATFKIDLKTNALTFFSINHTDEESQIYTQEECQRIAEDFVVEHLLPVEPYIDLEDYKLTVIDFSTSQWATVDYYMFEYRRWIDGYQTQDVITVSVTFQGNIKGYSRYDDYRDLETMEIDYERAESVAMDLANEVCQYVREGKAGEIFHAEFRRYYDGTFVIEYAISVSQKGIVEEQNTSAIYIHVSIGKPPSTESNSQ